MGKCFSTQKKNKNPQIEQQNDQMQNQTIKTQKTGINVMLDESEIIEEDETVKNQNVQNLIYLNQKVNEQQQQRDNKDGKEVILEKETVRKLSATNILHKSQENQQKATIEKSKQNKNDMEESQDNEVEDSSSKTSKRQQKMPFKEKSNEFKQETLQGKLTPKSKDNQKNLKFQKNLIEINAKETNQDASIQKGLKDQQQDLQKSIQIEEINLQMGMLTNNQEQSQQKCQLLQDSLSYLKLTVIQAIKFQQAESYLQNEYLIGEKGLQNSLFPSDSTYIGLSGDIQLHPQDICEEKQLQIQFMNENFYIIDHGKKFFTLIQITKEKPLKLRKNLLIQLGEQNLFVVLELQEPQQNTKETLKDQYLVIEFDNISDNKSQDSSQNENPIPKLKIQFLKGEHKNQIFQMDSSHNLLLGRSQKCKQGIQFRDMKIQHEHGMQAFKYRIEFNQYHGWIFKDCGSISGSWVVAKENYTKFENGTASLPLKIQNEMQLKVGNNTIFKVSSFNTKVTLPKEKEDQTKQIYSQQ